MLPLLNAGANEELGLRVGGNPEIPGFVVVRAGGIGHAVVIELGVGDFSGATRASREQGAKKARLTRSPGRQ